VLTCSMLLHSLKFGVRLGEDKSDLWRVIDLATGKRSVFYVIERANGSLNTGKNEPEFLFWMHSKSTLELEVLFSPDGLKG